MPAAELQMGLELLEKIKITEGEEREGDRQPASQPDRPV